MNCLLLCNTLSPGVPHTRIAMVISPTQEVEVLVPHTHLIASRNPQTKVIQNKQALEEETKRKSTHTINQQFYQCLKFKYSKKL